MKLTGKAEKTRKAGRRKNVERIDWDDLPKVLEEWLKNPYWAEYYNSAPSDRCRQFIALEFYNSEEEDEEAGKAMEAIEEQMNAEELRHLMNYCGNNPRKGSLARKIKEKEQ